MRKVILNSIFAICLLVSVNSCDYYWGDSEGFSSRIEREHFATPAGYGVLMVYFEKLCINASEKVSVYIDDELIGYISEAAGNKTPAIGTTSNSCITCYLATGEHTISYKIGAETEIMTEYPIKIEEDVCIRFVAYILCPQ